MQGRSDGGEKGKGKKWERAGTGSHLSKELAL
jgi:hypothetical protein